MISARKIKVDWTQLPQGIIFLFYGMPKTRKTTVASTWSEKGQDGVLIIDTDLGADFVENSNTVTVTSFREPYRDVIDTDGKQVLNDVFLPLTEIVPPEERGYVYRSGPDTGKPMPVYSLAEVINWILDTPDLPYDTIVIDTIDVVNSWAEEETCAELEINTMGEKSFGTDWATARKKIKFPIELLRDYIRRTGKNLILISHSKQTTMVDNKAQVGPELPKGIANAIMGMAEVIGHITIDKTTNTPVISFASSDEKLMGSRLKPLASQVIPFTYMDYRTKILSYKEASNGKNRI